MKKLCYFLLCLFVSFKSVSQETKKLPDIPWIDIVEMNSKKYSPIHKWNSDIKVKLEGNYTTSDSINIAKVLAKLNAITETIKIEFSIKETPNFKIIFLDTIVSDGYINSKVEGRFFHDLEGYENGELYIYNNEKKSNFKFENYLESRIARELVSSFFLYRSNNIGNKRTSIFNPLLSRNNNSKPLNKQDIAIIKEVYKPGFEEKLKIAEKQFKYVLDNLYKERVKNRDSNLWWVKNPEALIFLPALILVLLFLFLIGKIKESIDSKIEKDWIKFGIIALIALLFADILIILSVSFYDFLTIPNNYNQLPFIRLKTILATTACSIILFPVLFLFRYIELKIQKSSQIIFTKTALIFLSTGIIPFLIVMGMQYFPGQLVYDSDYLMLSKFFLYTMAIASLRALISFFIFKERHLIIKNETKLSNLRELKTKAELKSLQSQINPHFLYNALNSIASLVHTSADKTEKMALSLSDLFKYTINRQGKTISTVNDELNMVRSYLEIEQTRFGDRLEFVINVEDDLLKEEIPMFILQPLVENAVKHGISKIENKGVIELNILKTDKGLDIEVKDNGPNFPEGLISGHGLQTVYDLIRLNYDDKASLKWQNIPQKSISISIDKTA